MTRTFATWTFIVAIVRIYAAYNLHNKLYVLGEVGAVIVWLTRLGIYLLLTIISLSVFIRFLFGPTLLHCFIIRLKCLFLKLLKSVQDALVQ